MSSYELQNGTDMKTYTTDEIKDRYIGERGTEERELYEAEVRECIELCRRDETIRFQSVPRRKKTTCS